MGASSNILAPMNKQYRKECYEAFHDEMDQLEEDFQNGRISLQEYTRFKRNLEENLEQDLNELKRLDA